MAIGTPTGTATGSGARDVIRVVVIDDSAFNRQTISAMIDSYPGLRVVGRAADGEEGLKVVFQTQPDIVTLDLEMPRMDGFTFLRLLMAKRPTPVVVISSLSSKENVFKALELGALDFVAKPQRQISPDLHAIREDLCAKLKLVTQLRAVTLAERAAAASRSPRSTGQHAVLTLPTGAPPPPVPGTVSAPPMPSANPFAGDVPQGPAPVGPAPPRVVAIGASTGGPPALVQVLQALDPRVVPGVVITQHMPPKFTRAFAERLERMTRYRAREAETGDCLVPGVVLVAPGSASLALRRDGAFVRVTLEDSPPPGSDADPRHVPSIDRMFETASQAMGSSLLAVILTGMAGDGSRGARVVKAGGGRVLVEDPESAVVAGMPRSALAIGVVDEVQPLPRVAEAIDRFFR